ncbi:hypothetical protein B0H16DRAFT_1472735 [Mycena metata]|uniref:Uncharacterized protein n=1 Tax=Mycena metata TaxID=1033252 RepID=A0AAD7HMH7_9AGAR|nr:hypothetical protein B0H16DRAFT_1472735 [Mycena metata]
MPRHCASVRRQIAAGAASPPSPCVLSGRDGRCCCRRLGKDQKGSSGAATTEAAKVKKTAKRMEGLYIIDDDGIYAVCGPGTLEADRVGIPNKTYIARGRNSTASEPAAAITEAVKVKKTRKRIKVLYTIDYGRWSTVHYELTLLKCITCNFVIARGRQRGCTVRLTGSTADHQRQPTMTVVPPDVMVRMWKKAFKAALSTQEQNPNKEYVARGRNSTASIDVFTKDNPWRSKDTRE